MTEYFRQIVESHGKPYLVLQLDEHDSRLGYETRVEAAVRAFRNHHRSALAKDGSGRPPRSRRPLCLPRGRVDLSGKTILFPNWDSLSLRLVVSSVRKTGRDARLLEPSEASMRRSLRHNSGQCTPLNIIAQDFVEYVERHDLDPARTVLWMSASNIACNIRLYPHHIRTILRSHGKGFERAEVYTGAMTLLDISAALPYDVYLAYMFGGFIRRMGCRIRPVETHRERRTRSSKRESARWRRCSRTADRRRRRSPPWSPASRPSRHVTRAPGRRWRSSGTSTPETTAS